MRYLRRAPEPVQRGLALRIMLLLLLLLLLVLQRWVVRVAARPRLLLLLL